MHIPRIGRIGWPDKLENFAEMARQMRERWPGRRDYDDYLIVVGYLADGRESAMLAMAVNETA